MAPSLYPVAGACSALTVSVVYRWLMEAAKVSLNAMPTEFFRALQINARTFSALSTRFIIGRYGRNDLGFLWMFVEPALLCIGVMVMWSYTGGHESHGIGLISMVFSGYMPLTLWRHVSNSGGHIYRSAKLILIHRNITYIDVFLLRAGLEFISVSAATLMIYAVLFSFEMVPPVYDLADVLHGWFLMGGMAFGIAAILAAASEHFEVVEKFIAPIQYITLPISGCFFLLDWMPSSAREVLLYVPLVHGFELFRAGFFGPSVNTYASPGYAWVFAIVTTGFGFKYFEAIRDRIE